MTKFLYIFIAAALLGGCTTYVEGPPNYMGYNNYYPVSSYGVTEYAYPGGYSNNYTVRNSGVMPY